MPSVKCCRSHPLRICYVAPNASRDELEAPITAFSGGKEGDVASSPSPLENNQRSANRSFFAVSKVLPFACPFICYVVMRASERFRRAGSTNHCVFRWKRGRRCLVALSAWKQSKIGKQVFCLPSGKCCRSHASPPPMHLLCCNEDFQRRAASTNHCVFRWKRGRRCLVALSAWKQSKIGKQVFCLPSVKCSRSHPPECTKLLWALPATQWKPQSVRNVL